MQRRGDNEIIISAWSPDWVDGSGVRRVAEWYLALGQGWQASEIFDLQNAFLSTPLDTVRMSGHAVRRSDSASSSGDVTAVAYEIHRLRGGRSGPMEERIIEYAVSVVPCPVGLHAVDIRRPLPDDQRSRHEGSGKAPIQDALSELRAIRQTMPIAWALCSTAFSRGPSIAELYRNQGSRIHPGIVYVSKSVPREEVIRAFSPAAVEDVDSGFEVALARPFGGPMDALSNNIYEGLWKVLRKVSITGLPWDVLKAC